MRLSIVFSTLFAFICAGFGGFAYMDGSPRAALLAVLTWGAVTLIGHLLLSPYEQIAQAMEHLANGELDQSTISLSSLTTETSRMISATNRLQTRLRGIADGLDEMAAGRLDVLKVEAAVIRSGTLADADIPIKRGVGEIETSMNALHNQLRRLAIQARVLSTDDLHHSLLNEEVPGELGSAFHGVVRNFRDLSVQADRIALGDLEQATSQVGDLHMAFHSIATRSSELVGGITSTALQISASTEQISAVLHDQEFSASHQASSVEETQRTMETLLSSAKKIAESAQTVFKSAERTQANNRIVADRIGELKTHTERISEILEVIKSIADRSDLLALNASLEGMRAGEAGKGFTLVAAEMRRLAENIKESVSDIKGLLVDIRESALSSVMATEEGSNLSERTTESALKITLITQQQQSGTEQVTQSMDELSTLINQGVAGTRQLSTASAELVLMSEDLRHLVERFQGTRTAEVKPRKVTASRVVTRDLPLTKKAEVKPDEARLRATSRLTPIRMGVDDPPTVELGSLGREDVMASLVSSLDEKSEPDEKKTVDETIDSLLEDSNVEDETT